MAVAFWRDMKTKAPLDVLRTTRQEVSISNSHYTIARVTTSGRKSQPGKAADIPPDLLGEIFILSVSTLPWFFRSKLGSRHFTPLVVSQVCSTWRRVALHTAKIWDTFDVSDVKERRKRHRDLALYRMWLSYAGGRLQKLGINLRSWQENRKPAKILCRYLKDAQLETLVLALTGYQFQLLSGVAEEKLTGIQGISLILETMNGLKTCNRVHPFSKLIRSLNIKDGDLEDFVKLEPLLSQSWPQLQLFHCHIPLSLSRYMDLLQDMPSLEDCGLMISSVDVDSDDGLLTFPRLRKLALGLRCGDVDNAICHFSFPNLETFLLSAVPPFMDWTQDTREILKEQYNLHRLQDLTIFKSTAYPLRTLLTDAPMLTDIALLVKTLDDEAFEDISTGTIGRYIQDFLVFAQPGGVDEVKVKGMIEARHANAVNNTDDLKPFKHVGIIISPSYVIPRPPPPMPSRLGVAGLLRQLGRRRLNLP